jgi:hypothetical protein
MIMQDIKDNLLDFGLAIVIAGALLIGALAYFDVLTK